jgi:hypothetical protein
MYGIGEDYLTSCGINMEIPELVLLETVHRNRSLYLKAIRLLFLLDSRLDENHTSYLFQKLLA